MTKVGSNSEYQALISQLQGTFGQLSSMGAIKGGSYLNSVWGVAGNVEALVDGDESQKSSAIQGLINNVLSIVEKLGNQEAARARKEVKDGEKAAQQLSEDQKQALTELNNGLEEIGNDIENQGSIVDTANGTIDASQAELIEKQEKINDIIKQIQQKQQELTQTTDPEKQKAILTEIQGLSGQIAVIVAEVETIQTKVQAAAESVEQAVVEIETAKGNAVEIQENGTLKVTELAQQGAQEVAETSQTQAAGVQNGVVAKALEAQAAASNFIPVAGGAASAKLSQTAVDQEMASGVRTAGALGNLRTLMQGIGGLTENTNLLVTFQNAIGSALDVFDRYVGDYNTKIEPLITSIGSFVGDGDIAVTKSELDSAVEADLSNIEARLSGEDSKPEEEAEEGSEEDPVEAALKDAEATSLYTLNVELNPFEIV